MNNAHGATTRGFTLLQLLVTLAVFGALSAIVIVVVNPVETLRRARDSQRIADLGVIVAAIEQFRVDVPDADVRYDGDPTPAPGGNFCNDAAFGHTRRWVSDPATTDSTVYGGDATIHIASQAIDGTGWLPVNLTLVPGLPPTPRFPVDPVNNVVNSNQDGVSGSSTAASVTENARMYIYGCKEIGSDSPTFEIDTNLESQRYGRGGSADKESTDSGDNPNIYEVGLSRFVMTGA